MRTAIHVCLFFLELLPSFLSTVVDFEMVVAGGRRELMKNGRRVPNFRRDVIGIFHLDEDGGHPSTGS